jgi:hypothetical protein
MEVVMTTSLQRMLTAAVIVPATLTALAAAGVAASQAGADSRTMHGIASVAAPITPARLPVYYLSEVDPVAQSGWWETGAADINGRTYLRSLNSGSWYVGGDGEAQYNLRRSCRTLRFAAGLRDDSDPGGSAELTVFGDGRQLAVINVTFGRSSGRRVPVAGVLRLRLVATGTADTDNTYYPAFGNARVRCSRPL